MEVFEVETTMIADQAGTLPKYAADMLARGWVAVHQVSTAKGEAQVWEDANGGLSFHLGSRSIAKRWIKARSAESFHAACVAYMANVPKDRRGFIPELDGAVPL